MIRSMISADCNEIATIGAQTFSTALDHNSLLALSENPFFFGFVDDVNVVDVVCDGSSIIAGYLLANIVSNEAEILSIAISADYQNFGKATGLIMYLKEFLAEKNVKTVFLEVASDNKAALALYRSSGFCEFGRRASYYKRYDSRCDAIKMKLHVNEAFP